jgi:phosphohistidine phosphatase
MGEVVIVRHAIALDREVAAQDGIVDEARPLTAEGKKRMKKAAAGLRRLIPQIHTLASSPLLRAVQTAQVIARVYGLPESIQTEMLAPNTPPEMLLDWAQIHSADGPLALVGHEPDLSCWVGWLLTGESRAILHLKKGGVCLLAFSGQLTAGEATLRWALTPRQLRQLAD